MTTECGFSTKLEDVPKILTSHKYEQPSKNWIHFLQEDILSSLRGFVKNTLDHRYTTQAFNEDLGDWRDSASVLVS